MAVWSFFGLVLTPSGLPAWCWLQARPKCWLLGHIFYFSVVLVLFWLSCFIFDIRVNTDLFEALSQSIQNRTKKRKEKDIHRIFSTTRNPATTPPSKIPSPHLCQTNIKKPSVNTHMYQATRSLLINPSPLTQQPTSPTARPGQILSKGFFIRHHPLEIQCCHPNKRLKHQPIPRPLRVPLLS